MDRPDKDRERWNKRYRTGRSPARDEPAELLTEAISWLPEGRALDVATGAGRNALFLAEQGYQVDAVDISDVGLSIAKRNATKAGLHINWIQADLDVYAIPPRTYAVICVVGYYDLHLLGDLKEALVPGGILLCEHHLGPARLADRGPKSDRFRFRSNELLRSCLDLTVLDYREWSRVDESEDGDLETDPHVSIIARNGLSGKPWYPPEQANNRSSG